ncbi:MAG: transketolase [Methylobacterium sp.]|nr:transketolase [Methylobacterium sp.]MCA3607466.1 transketolase [Methylobacterium sp.]MCA3609034.1 transketolase [Methylobacterium sp.]MCA3617766.1 transketolase [Methylobacterium sp.]MCA3619635.1 transketolase [Methylobacterium sp.]
MISRREHDAMANAIRALAMDAVEAAKSGHPGLPMGAADIATVLFRDHLNFDPAHPTWPDRDRFILSAGHGSMLIYALLHLVGVKELTIEQLKNFRQLGSITAGHPEHGHIPGVETTTGPLGQGLGNAVGMALAERILAARHGGNIVDHYTYVLASDGDLMEGISQESITLAGHMKLKKLIVLFDDNGISIDGAISVSDSTDQLKRFESAGWNAERIDGHDPEAINAAIIRAKNSDKPSLIACVTTIGYGAPTKAGKSSSHGSPLGAEELKGAKEKLGWAHGPFEVPTDIYKAWGAVGSRGAAARAAWQERLGKAKPKARAEFERVMAGELPKGLARALKAFKAEASAKKPEVATRKASEMVLEAIQPALPELLSGSADLTGSNNTKTRGMAVVKAGAYDGAFVHYGIREHGMAAAMNGIALHGGLIPASGTFLVFSDYCRPSIRLSALMNQRVIYVMTHDSIGVGEDGPTHQPVEHLAALRAIPNLDVYRPCDVTETAEAWELAVATKDRPSLIALTRQNLPQLRMDNGAKNLSSLGAYEIARAEGRAEVTLFATGSEVSLAMKARSLLLAEGILARVVSVPCFERFAAQPEAYRRRVIGRTKVKIAIEAAIRQGWDAIIGSDGHFIGMEGFGASGPIHRLYAHFGITPEAVVARARAALKR